MVNKEEQSIILLLGSPLSCFFQSGRAKRAEEQGPSLSQTE
jgi:hypothetical protein